MSCREENRVSPLTSNFCLLSFMSAPPGASDVPLASTAQRKKTRLPKAGTSILNDFFFTVSHHPSHEQQRVLLAQIHQSIDPTYTLKHLQDWFTRKRASEKQPASNRGTVRIPLNPEQIRHLTELYNSNKNPTFGLLQTWSSLLKVKTTVVTDWIEEKNKLPSPAPTVSPEPNLPSIYRRSTSVSTPLSVPSPVIANTRFALFKPEPPQSPVRPALSPILPPAVLPPSSPSPLLITRVPEEDTYKAGFWKRPITRETLNELFKGPEADMKAFRGMVARGELRHQGYTPGIYVSPFCPCFRTEHHVHVAMAKSRY
ncbi:hypothetical protein EV421DRAFT_1860925 [Armillaria borealis]|uniref:Homeobox domain-containing protein n=1 Tax=Armillaria borealis TaxID=47425 RepID=A0AA39IUD9_9AGAR|nr:hypothetical protein EV421DRAFT_1860925 [Armillaria borealis]